MIAPNDKAAAQSRTAFDLGIDLLLRGRGDARSASAPRQFGQSGQRLAGRAFTADELEKGDRADPVGPGQPQAVETLLVGQARQGAASFLAPKRGS